MKELRNNILEYSVIFINFHKNKPVITVHFQREVNMEINLILSGSLEGYLGKVVPFVVRMSPSLCRIQLDFSLSSIQDIDAIREAVVYNIEKVIREIEEKQ